MSEAGGNGINNESPDAGASSAAAPGAAAKAHAPKDRSCPYCGQAFTSSSLGRHLDLYIKEKNPKPPDGVHDVDAIRKTRAGITRRQPRGSLAARRDASTPGTPTASTPTARRSPDARQHASLPKDGQFVVDQAAVYPWQPRWEATGVINDLPVKSKEQQSGNWDDGADQARKGSAQQVQRAPTRLAQKQQLDARQKLTDAVDTARAAELALRELLSSLRAAKQQVDMHSLPFDFDPLSLDFPALTLQCLQPPPTLFSSTPIPTSTSWSLQPPAQRQYEALVAFFQEEFKKWRHTCVAATTVLQEDLTYPLSQNHVPQDGRENVKKAEKAAANLEKQVNEHLQSTFAAWEQIPPQRQHELWTLELARSVGRRQKDIQKLKHAEHSSKQEKTNLQSQIEHLNRLQQPKEFRIMPPTTIPFDQSYLSYILTLGIEGTSKNVGMSLDDRHVDLGTLVQNAIERWKNVIVSSRTGGGLGAQKPLDQPLPAPPSASTPASAPALSSAAPTPTSTSAQQQSQARQIPPTTNGPPNDSRSTTTAPTSATSIANDEVSDEDADAEMEDDDSFAPVAAPLVSKQAPQQSLQKLQMARAREHAQRNSAQYMNGTGNVVGNQRRNIARPIANMNPGGVQPPQTQRSQQGTIQNDFGSAVQGMGNGDSMYID